MAESEKNWPHVCRIIWLSGGVIAVNEPGASVKIEAGINGSVLYELQLPTYASIFDILAQFGFPAIGATFIVDMDELQGIRPPQFRALIAGQRTWRVFELHQKWRQVAHAASQKNEMALMDVTSRITSELRYCEIRLLNLTEAYGAQLAGKAKQGAINGSETFKDLNSLQVYLAIHALFWELAVLRDNLAEFAAQIVFGFDNVTTLTGLLKQLPASKWKDDELAKEILIAGSDAQAGWVAIFTAYRNLFTHNAPMEQAAGIAFAHLDQMVLKDGRTIPQLYYPLPREVNELLKRRSKGVLYKNFDELIAASTNKRPVRETEPDALLYLHSILGKMTTLAELLIQRSPIVPEMIHITEEDVIGTVQIVN
jgi:hypothetical protein